MKWYQPIECDKTVEKPLVCDYCNFEEFGYVEDDFKSGKKINEWSNKILIKATQKKYDGNPDDVLQNAYMIPIYSEKLVNELTKANIKGIQYLPIKVLDFNNQEMNTFYIANFLNFPKAFDYDKSIYNRFSDDFPNPNVRGAIAGVLKFALNGKGLDGLDIIRLNEYNQRFFVSEKYVNLFEKNHFTGYSFKEIEIC